MGRRPRSGTSASRVAPPPTPPTPITGPLPRLHEHGAPSPRHCDGEGAFLCARERPRTAPPIRRMMVGTVHTQGRTMAISKQARSHIESEVSPWVGRRMTLEEFLVLP